MTSLGSNACLLESMEDMHISPPPPGKLIRVCLGGNFAMVREGTEIWIEDTIRSSDKVLRVHLGGVIFPISMALARVGHPDSFLAIACTWPTVQETRRVILKETDPCYFPWVIDIMQYTRRMGYVSAKNLKNGWDSLSKKDKRAIDDLLNFFLPGSRFVNIWVTRDLSVKGDVVVEGRHSSPLQSRKYGEVGPVNDVPPCGGCAAPGRTSVYPD